MLPRVFYLGRILGKRAFVSFAVVSFLIVALLAAVNIASRYALKEYVEDQIARIPWDITTYQMTDVNFLPEMGRALETVDGITERRNILFLRATTTPEDRLLIDGKPLRSTWLSFLTTSDPAMLPSDIRPSPGKATLVLVGSKSQMGNAYAALQGTRHLSVSVGDGKQTAKVLDVPLDRAVRVERNDLNRWFLDETSSPALMPEIGVIIVGAFDKSLYTPFDAMAKGSAGRLAGVELEQEYAGNYYPDIIHLLRLDRARLVSGWDLERSLARLQALDRGLVEATQTIGPTLFVDNTTRVLLERMAATARQVGLISLLVSLPLLWMGWVLLGNLCRLLLLNARRTFGLMRLRGVPGPQLGRAMQLAIGSGAVLGGVLGALAGTVVPLWLYEGQLLPLGTLVKVQQPHLLGLFVLLGLGIALVVSRKLVRYAATISPLEASGRVAASESAQADVRFGVAELVALLLGSFKMLAWILGLSLTAVWDAPTVASVDRALDFIGFPLFVYGVVTLLASRRRWLAAALGVTVRLTGGPLRELALKHIATRPHRIAGFLLIVGLMTCISLYPTVMEAVFDNKIVRGARVQLGSDLQVMLNAGDIVDNRLLASGGIGEQYQAIAQRMAPVLRAVNGIAGVAGSALLVEGIADGLYMPGYGYNGLPVYFIPSSSDYLRTLYHEESLGQDAAFSGLVRQLSEGKVVLSAAVANYTKKGPGTRIPLGRDLRGQLVRAEVAGAVHYLPGSPLASVTDKDSFGAARIDYVNYLFNNNAYIVADPATPALRDLDVLVTGIHLAVSARPGADLAALRAALLGVLPAEPLAVHSLDEELRKVGTDMYVFLARANVQIYLIGGVLLALVGILSIAYANYLEDRRTLGLLRIRGVGFRRMLEFFGAGLFAPAVLGLVLGMTVSLIVGYGITNLVWELRAVQNILVYLSTQLAVSALTLGIALLLCTILLLVGVSFSGWVFRRTAREGLSEA